MNGLDKLWLSTGLHHMEAGQAIMILVCLVLLYLAIVRRFEPLLLVPIGFGGLMANIPVAGLAESAVSQALNLGSDALVAQIAHMLGAGADLAGKELYATYQAAEPALRAQIHELALDANYSDGLLYLIYTVGLTTDVFPLLIFMGVGAMTEFGPLLANPRSEEHTSELQSRE